MTLKEPLIPMHLFKDRGYVASMLSLALGASVYYSQAIIWPGMAVNVYAQGRPMWAGWVSTLVGIGITVGVSTSDLHYSTSTNATDRKWLGALWQSSLGRQSSSA
jgi:hypothetical protein